MSPIRAPSPFDTASEPGDALLLAPSISLESSEIQSHEKALLTHVTYPSNEVQVERIPVSSEDLYPTASNGPTKVKRCYVCVRKTVKSVMAYVRGIIESPVPESTSTTHVEDIIPAAAAEKARLFGEALAALPSLSSSVYTKAALEGGLGKFEAALKSLGIPEDEDDEVGGKTPEEEFVFVNIINHLDGDGEGYIEMYAGVVPDVDDQQELAILHCGSEF